ncbi:MAG: ATP-binding protein [Hydrogenophaga sp.]
MTAPARTTLPPVVCLLGGESSGKTTLSTTLCGSLKQHHGLSVAGVSEHLRIWCERHQRAPRANEQAAIACEQTRQIQEAQASPGVQLVIADTSALTVAAYSALYFADPTLLPPALATQSLYASTLLMGLDLPWRPDGLFRDGPAHRADADTLLRRELQAQRIPFHAIYGTGDQRLRNALRALTPILSPLLGQAPVSTDELRTQGRPGWVCEACSDPDCEHRLFSKLLSNHATASNAP